MAEKEKAKEKEKDASVKPIEPRALYNMLQRGTFTCSRLTDPNFLLLLDARIKSEYNEAHIMTAKKAPKNDAGQFMVPYDAEVACKQNIVVYDNRTVNLANKDAPAVICANMMWDAGSRFPVMVLRGGYEEFSALYPFLRTQKIIYMPRELSEIRTYPVEVMNGLFLGTWEHAKAAYIQKDLMIRAHIACSEHHITKPGIQVMRVEVKDNNNAEIYPYFEGVSMFIDMCLKKRRSVLIFSDLGISRAATIATAFIMKNRMWPLELAYRTVSKSQPRVRPNRAFIEQLSMWEERLFGACSTNIEDPNF